MRNKEYILVNKTNKIFILLMYMFLHPDLILHICQQSYVTMQKKGSKINANLIPLQMRWIIESVVIF